MTTYDQDENIMLATLLGGVWPRSPFMEEIARKTPSTLREFMDRADGLAVEAERNLSLQEEWRQGPSPPKYYSFHRSSGHNTQDCYTKWGRFDDPKTRTGRRNDERSESRREYRPNSWRNQDQSPIRRNQEWSPIWKSRDRSPIRGSRDPASRSYSPVRKGYGSVRKKNASPGRRKTTHSCKEDLHQRNSKREEPPVGEINTIAVGYAGEATSSAQKAHARKARYGEVFSTQRLHRKDPSREHLITFSEEDGEGLLRPHDDALVVMAQIANYRTRRVLIDNGSSADILFWEAFSRMRISPDRLRPAPMPLKGYTGDAIQPAGAIAMSVLVGMAPKTTSLMVDFLVVKAPSSYNVIVGRPLLNQIKVVTSTYYLKVKFLTACGVGEMRGEQQAVRDCYTREMKSKVVIIQTLASSRRQAAKPAPPVRTGQEQEEENREAQEQARLEGVV
ncbi:uncharacterized protein LOC121240778 [Juglans microcarpa x Juglans regia]|uniref:uncharacterized protein LOC121240778 n=1 Tax=Juglans microcarpa x Juglans regia TaxID=2249226 RepID=UPI001B7F6142|nr:uncharacterized protein LOC121240778 [Juglans microcarpa x Juglans regia]